MKRELTIFAQELRKNQTPEEAKRWYQFLRKYPVRFRRQFPIGHYIADFYCAGAKIVIELDGSQHYQQEVRDYDARRTAMLERKGLKVIRFSNREIDQEFFRVCTAIDMEVKDRVGARNVPSSAPFGGTFPPRGR